MQDAPYVEMEYPWIWGTDVAGTVAELGSNVTRFKIGDRVIGYALQWLEQGLC
jgi:NADPH:quinone reductase-like Zn-dependent oxidoreductase